MGSGDVVVVVVESILEMGVAVAAAVGMVVIVVLVVFVVAGVMVGEGFTIVVLVSDFPAGEAPGAVTSVRCSQAAKSAAPARMVMNFFMIWFWVARAGYSWNRTDVAVRPCGK